MFVELVEIGRKSWGQLHAAASSASGKTSDEHSRFFFLLIRLSIQKIRSALPGTVCGKS